MPRTKASGGSTSSVAAAAATVASRPTTPPPSWQTPVPPAPPKSRATSRSTATRGGGGAVEESGDSAYGMHSATATAAARGNFHSASVSRQQQQQEANHDFQMHMNAAALTPSSEVASDSPFSSHRRRRRLAPSDTTVLPETPQTPPPHSQQSSQQQQELRQRMPGEIVDSPRRGRRMANSIQFGWGGAATRDEEDGSSLGEVASPPITPPPTTARFYGAAAMSGTKRSRQQQREAEASLPLPNRSSSPPPVLPAPIASSSKKNKRQRILTRATLHDAQGWATAMSLQQAPDASALAYLATASGGDDEALAYLDWPVGEEKIQSLQHHRDHHQHLHHGGREHQQTFGSNDLLEEYLVGFKQPEEESDLDVREDYSARNDGTSSVTAAVDANFSAPAKLVGMHVDGVGRVAVASDLAPSLHLVSAAGPASSCAASSSSAFSDGSSCGGATQSTQNTSIAGEDHLSKLQHQQPTLSTTANGSLMISPSFSIASHFPASELGSPMGVLPAGADGGHASRDSPINAKTLLDQMEAQTRIAYHVQHLRRVMQRACKAAAGTAATTSSQQTLPSPPPPAAASRPRLRHSSGAVQRRLPRLAWPDRTDGPWAAATEEAQARRARRLEGVRAWLATPGDESAAEEEESRRQAEPFGLGMQLPIELVEEETQLSQQTVSEQLQSIVAGVQAAAAASATASSATDSMRHPMIAKALADRARKLALREAHAAEIAARSVAALPQLQLQKSSRGSKGKKGMRGAANAASAARKKRSHKAGLMDTAAAVAAAAEEKYMALSTPLPLSRQAAGDAFVGCFCGLSEEAAAMVQCDTCERWYHMPCVGYKDAEGQEMDREQEQEWHCHGCIVRNGSRTTPNSSVYSGGLAPITPSIFQQSHHRAHAHSDGARNHTHASHHTQHFYHSASSQPRHDEPVFAQPTNSPLHSRGSAFVAALALAPSPPTLSSARMGGAAHRKAGAQGRARAERFGWQSNEPGSPLERKSFASHSRGPTTGAVGGFLSTPIYKHARANTRPGLEEGAATPSTFAGLTRSDWSSHLRVHTRSPMLPSARQGGAAAIASAQASHLRSPAVAAVTDADFDDDEAQMLSDNIFSTPSRLDHSSAWTTAATPRETVTPLGAGSVRSGAAGGNQARTPCSTRNREASGGWALPAGLSTPSRDFLGGAFSTEHSAYSVGLPSLVHSSAGPEHPSHRGVTHEQTDRSRSYLLQSPSSSTRAARSRGASGGANGAASGAAANAAYASGLLRTPELYSRTLGSPTSVSSMRDNRPYPSQQQQQARNAGGVPSSSPLIKTPRGGQDDDARRFHPLGPGAGNHIASSKKLVRISSGPVMDREHDAEPLGLGIGIDLDDEVFQWS